MAWVYLDDQFPDHPKIVLAGGDAGWLWACGLAYTRRYATEGRIPKGQVPKLSDRRNPMKLARRLVEVGLWEDDGDHFRFHDYGDWNKPQASRSEAARKAARARWERTKGDANADAAALPGASGTQSERTAEADASTCPPPQPPVVTSADNSRLLVVLPDDDDQADTPAEQGTYSPTVETALAILAARDLDERQHNDQLRPIGDPDAWVRTAHERRRASDGQHLAELADLDPDANPEQLVDALIPPVADAETAATDDTMQTAARARQEAGMVATAQLHEIEPPAPGVVAAIAEQHAHLPRRRKDSA